MARIGPAEVRERYGVNREQVPDFIALRSDPSDKLPGARGVGPKRAAALLNQFGSLEPFSRPDSSSIQAEDLKLYRRLATVDAAAPLPDSADQQPNWANAARLARKWEVDGLARRLEGLAAPAPRGNA